MNYSQICWNSLDLIAGTRTSQKKTSTAIMEANDLPFFSPRYHYACCVNGYAARCEIQAIHRKTASHFSVSESESPVVTLQVVGRSQLLMLTLRLHQPAMLLSFKKKLGSVLCWQLRMTLCTLSFVFCSLQRHCFLVLARVTSEVEKLNWSKSKCLSRE